MNRFVLFGGLCISSVVLLGIGVSFAHTEGLFEPTEPDWLTVSKQNTVVVPESAPAVVTRVPSDLAPATNLPRQIEADVVTASAPALPESQPADSSQLRPVVAPMVAKLPDVSRPIMTEDTYVPPHVVAAQDAVAQQNVLTPVRSPQPRSHDAGASLIAPPDVAHTATDPINNAWMLGVFR